MVEKVPLQIDRRAQVDLLLQGKNEHERGRRKRLFVLRMRKSSERNVRNENSGDKHWRCLLRCFQVLTHRLQLLILRFGSRSGGGGYYCQGRKSGGLY